VPRSATRPRASQSRPTWRGAQKLTPSTSVLQSQFSHPSHKNWMWSGGIVYLVSHHRDAYPALKETPPPCSAAIRDATASVSVAADLARRGAAKLTPKNLAVTVLMYRILVVTVLYVPRSGRDCLIWCWQCRDPRRNRECVGRGRPGEARRCQAPVLYVP